MTPRWIAIAFSPALLLSGCSSTPAELEAKAAPSSQSFAENYQEIYRRVSSAARQCMAGNVGAYASMAVDTDLFPDLGYGEIRTSLINWGARNYYLSIKIEKAGTGSRMTTKSGNTLGAERMVQSAQRWASGDQGC